MPAIDDVTDTTFTIYSTDSIFYQVLNFSRLNLGLEPILIDEVGITFTQQAQHAVYSKTISLNYNFIGNSGEVINHDSTGVYYIYKPEIDFEGQDSVIIHRIINRIFNITINVTDPSTK